MAASLPSSATNTIDPRYEPLDGLFADSMFDAHERPNILYGPKTLSAHMQRFMRKFNLHRAPPDHVKEIIFTLFMSMILNIRDSKVATRQNIVDAYFTVMKATNDVVLFTVRQVENPNGQIVKKVRANVLTYTPPDKVGSFFPLVVLPAESLNQIMRHINDKHQSPDGSLLETPKVAHVMEIVRAEPPYQIYLDDQERPWSVGVLEDRQYHFTAETYTKNLDRSTTHRADKLYYPFEEVPMLKERGVAEYGDRFFMAESGVPPFAKHSLDLVRKCSRLHEEHKAPKFDNPVLFPWFQAGEAQLANSKSFGVVVRPEFYEFDGVHTLHGLSIFPPNGIAKPTVYCSGLESKTHIVPEWIRTHSDEATVVSVDLQHFRSANKPPLVEKHDLVKNNLLDSTGTTVNRMSTQRTVSYLQSRMAKVWYDYGKDFSKVMKYDLFGQLLASHPERRVYHFKYERDSHEAKVLASEVNTFLVVNEKTAEGHIFNIADGNQEHSGIRTPLEALTFDKEKMRELGVEKLSFFNIRTGSMDDSSMLVDKNIKHISAPNIVPPNPKISGNPRFEGTMSYIESRKISQLKSSEQSATVNKLYDGYRGSLEVRPEGKWEVLPEWSFSLNDQATLSGRAGAHIVMPAIADIDKIMKDAKDNILPFTDDAQRYAFFKSALMSTRNLHVYDHLDGQYRALQVSIRRQTPKDYFYDLGPSEPSNVAKRTIGSSDGPQAGHHSAEAPDSSTLSDEITNALNRRREDNNDDAEIVVCKAVSN